MEQVCGVEVEGKHLTQSDQLESTSLEISSESFSSELINTFVNTAASKCEAFQNCTILLNESLPPADSVLQQDLKIDVVTTLMPKNPEFHRTDSLLTQVELDKEKVQKVTQENSKQTLVESKSNLSLRKTSSREGSLKKLDGSNSSATTSETFNALKGVRLHHQLGHRPGYLNKDPTGIDRKSKSAQENKVENPGQLRSRIPTAPHLPAIPSSLSSFAGDHNDVSDSLVKKNLDLSEKAVEMRQKFSNLLKQNVQLQKKLDDNESKLAEKEKLLTEKFARIQKLEKFKVQYDKEIKKGSGNLEDFNEKIKTLEEQNLNYQKEKEKNQHKDSTQKSTIVKLQNEGKKMQTLLDELYADKESIRHDKMTLEKTLQALKLAQEHDEQDAKQQTQLEKKLKEMLVTINCLEMKLKERDIVINTMRQKFESLSDENVRLLKNSNKI